MKLPLMPKNIARIGSSEKFSFACNSTLSCFTDCCRQLDLALTPYDVLRLKNALKISSSEFLNRYVIIEQEDDDVFPRLYLTMFDDGRASCVFVNKNGCSVYKDRPGACRAYPMGRASMRKTDNTFEEYYVLLNEEHCHGFAESDSQTPLEYSHSKGLEQYNMMNDALIAILQHEKIRQGMRLSTEQIQQFLLALYDLDAFREKLRSGSLHSPHPSKQELVELEDDEKLLQFGIEWLTSQLFAKR
jgi:uncharacterized protein